MSLNRSILLVLPLLASVPAQAQTAITGQPATGGASSATSGGQNAVTRPNTDHAQDGKPASTGALANVKLEPGANSFTEGQVRSRIESAGFTKVSGLAKDADGIWRGHAEKEGRTLDVGFDFKGQIAVR